MLIQQYCFLFIIQTNEAHFLSKPYLLSDNEKLGGCIMPGYRQPLPSLSLMLCQVSKLLFDASYSLKILFVSTLVDLTFCTRQLTILGKYLLLMTKPCSNLLLMKHLGAGHDTLIIFCARLSDFMLLSCPEKILLKARSICINAFSIIIRHAAEVVYTIHLHSKTKDPKEPGCIKH